MLKFLTPLVAMLLAVNAWAAQAPETPVVTGPSFQQVPLSQALINIPNLGPTQLGTALAGACGVSTTGCSSSGPISVTSPIQKNSFGLNITRSGNCNGTVAGPNCSSININDTITGVGAPEYHNWFFSELNLGGSLTQTWQNLYSTVQIDSGTTTNAEVNAFHSLIINNGTMVSQAESAEIAVQNGGTISGTAYGDLSFLTNTSTGTVTGGFVVHNATYSNANTTAGSVAAFVGYECDPKTGTGSTATSARCIYNTDPLQAITTEGHLAFRHATQPVLSGCGTSPSLDTFGSDMTGTITEGASATGCTVTFAVSFAVNGNTWAPHCVISSPNGSALTSYSVTTSALTIVNSSSSGNQYTYACFGSI